MSAVSTTEVRDSRRFRSHIQLSDVGTAYGATRDQRSSRNLPRSAVRSADHLGVGYPSRRTGPSSEDYFKPEAGPFVKRRGRDAAHAPRRPRRGTGLLLRRRVAAPNGRRARALLPVASTPPIPAADSREPPASLGRPSSSLSLPLLPPVLRAGPRAPSPGAARLVRRWPGPPGSAGRGRRRICSRTQQSLTTSWRDATSAGRAVSRDDWLWVLGRDVSTAAPGPGHAGPP